MKYTRAVVSTGIAYVFSSICIVISLSILARSASKDVLGYTQRLLLYVNLLASLEVVRIPLARMIHEIGCMDDVVAEARSISLKCAFLFSFGIPLALYFIPQVLLPLSSTLAIIVSSFFWFLSAPYAGLLIASHQMAKVQSLRAATIALSYVGFAFISNLTGQFYVYDVWLVLVFVAYFFCLRRHGRSIFGELPVAGGLQNDSVKKKLRGDAIYLLLFSVCASVTGTIDRIVLNTAIPLAAFGTYTAIFEFFSRFSLAPSLAAKLAFSYVSKAHSNRNSLDDYLDLFVVVIGALSSFCLVPAVLFAPDLIHILFGSRAEGWSWMVSVMAVAVQFQAVGYFSAVLLNALGDFSTQLKVFVAMSVLGTPLVMFLVYVYGSKGAAVGFTLTRSADIILGVFAYRRVFSELTPSVRFLAAKSIGAVGGLTFFAMISQYYFSSFWVSCVFVFVNLIVFAFVLINHRSVFSFGATPLSE